MKCVDPFKFMQQLPLVGFGHLKCWCNVFNSLILIFFYGILIYSDIHFIYNCKTTGHLFQGLPYTNQHIRGFSRLSLHVSLTVLNYLLLNDLQSYWPFFRRYFRENIVGQTKIMFYIQKIAMFHNLSHTDINVYSKK